MAPLSIPELRVTTVGLHVCAHVQANSRPSHGKVCEPSSTCAELAARRRATGSRLSATSVPRTRMAGQRPRAKCPPSSRISVPTPRLPRRADTRSHFCLRNSSLLKIHSNLCQGRDQHGHQQCWPPTQLGGGLLRSSTPPLLPMSPLHCLPTKCHH